jgi:hypothetical protein
MGFLNFPVSCQTDANCPNHEVCHGGFCYVCDSKND